MRFHTHWEVWALAAALLATYFYSLRRFAPLDRKATWSQVRSFCLGVVALVAGAQWPIHDLSEHYLYSAHMVQHMLFTMALPPLVLAGTPDWLFRAFVPQPAMRALRVLARPIIALAVFNSVLVFTHWPTIVNFSVRSEFGHFSLHVLLVASAFVMWLPVLSPVIEIPRMSYPGQMVYLFLQSLVPTVPASFLTFGDRPLYHIYETFPRLWGISALADQRTAGLIMKIGGGAILWGFMTVIFFRWFRMEHTDGVDALALHDVESHLNRMELTKNG